MAETYFQNFSSQLAASTAEWALTKCVKKRHPFYFRDTVVRFYPILLIFGINVPPMEFQTNIYTRSDLHLFYLFVLYLVKISDASKRTPRRPPLLINLVV